MYSFYPDALNSGKLNTIHAVSLFYIAEENFEEVFVEHRSKLT